MKRLHGGGAGSSSLDSNHATSSRSFGRPAARLLAIIPPDDAHRAPLDGDLTRSFERFGERDIRDRGQHLDAEGLQPESVAVSIAREERRRCFVSLERCSECGERTEHAVRVLGVCAHEHVEIVGGADAAVHSHGPAADQEKVTALIRERNQQIAKINGELV